MKAVIYSEYGSPSVLRVDEVEKPIIGKDEVLVAIKATSVNSGDGRVRGMQTEGIQRFMMRLLMGWDKPRHPILGTVFAGEIAEVGVNTTRFKIGDSVLGSLGMKMGTYAEFIAVKEDGIIMEMPYEMSYEEAASIPFGGLTALSFIKRAKLRPKSKVLVYGAAGSVGSAAVQVLRNLGHEVTAVSRAKHHILLKSLGANRTLDYSTQEFSKDKEMYDFIFDCVGYLDKKVAKERLLPSGVYKTVSGYELAKESLDSLDQLMQWYESKQFVAVIDRVYPMDEVVEAHQYLDSKQKQGNIILKIE